MKAKLLVTDSYFGLFSLLIKELDGKVKTVTGKNLIFCEEKASLSVERAVCNAFNGTFNTEACSFGKFLRKNKNFNNLLSREGSAMAVKKLLNETPLKCFNRSKANLASSLFELISQLKSAKISPLDLKTAESGVSGVLKNKLADISAIFSAYEEYLINNGFEDQSTALSYLPEIIENSAEVKGADVFLFGFSGFTVQICKIITSLLRTAKSVTAILIAGDNKFAFVNETAERFLSLCKAEKITPETVKIPSDYSEDAERLKNGLFSPAALCWKKENTDKISRFSAPNVFAETERVAELIRKTVTETGCRFRDITVIIPSSENYKDAIHKAFSLLEIPYFLDERKKPENYPLISLIYAYLNLFIKGLSLDNFAEFFKNRYVSCDKDLNDRFCNYLYKYNLSYERLKNPLTFPASSSEELEEFESFRLYVVSLLKKFDVKTLLKKVNAEEKTKKDASLLLSEGAFEEAAVNSQMADFTLNIVKEIEMILGPYVKAHEYKTLFTGGVSAMEVSIIPQYNDAVFIGGFKQAALNKAKHLFVLGLTSEVPAVKEDVALLSDGDINLLSGLKVLLEPKISVVNHRAREETLLGLSAWENTLYLSYPVSDVSGNRNVKSEVLNYVESLFTVNHLSGQYRYLTKKQGLKDFSSDCGRFVGGKSNDFSYASGYFHAVKNDKILSVINHANKEIKVRLKRNENLIKNVTSPTKIESFYSCPYRSFIERALKATPREQGVLDAPNAGSLVHEIFCKVFEDFDGIKTQEDLRAVFDDCAKSVLKEDKFKKYLSDAQNEYSVSLILKESYLYCQKTYLWLKSSGFKTGKGLLEVKFGEKRDDKDPSPRYPPISLLGGKVKLSGVIDRIDVSDDYCRIIDYKTGGVDASPAALFTGNKLQLYLYASAVNDKKTAGAYYVKIKDEYSEEDAKATPLAAGVTLNDENLVLLQDEHFATEDKSEFIPVKKKNDRFNNLTSKENLENLKKYALILAENAAKEMMEGVIIPSPFKNACEYCPFSAVCGKAENSERTVRSVTEDCVAESARGYGEK